MTEPEVAVAAPVVDVPVGSGRVPDPTGATGTAGSQDAPAVVGSGTQDVPDGYIPPEY